MIAGTVFAPLPAVPPLATPSPSASDPVAAVLGDNVILPTWTLPPVQDDALLWKERYTGGRTLFQVPEVVLVGGGLLICGGIEFLLVAAVHVQEAQPTSLGNSVRIVALMCRPILTVLYASLLFAFTVGVAFRAAASVVRERQHHTLDMLLTLPVTRGEILRAKFLGAIYKGWSWAVLIAGVVFLGTIVGAFHPLTVAYLLLCPIPLIVVVCSVALLVSVIARTVLQANLAVAGLLLGATVLALQTQAGAVLGAGSLNLSMWDDVLVTRESLVEAGLYVGACFGAAVAAFGTAERLFERADRR